MKNKSMELQINNAIRSADAFVKALEYAALADDGTVDAQESRTIKKLTKATEQYKKALEESKSK